MDQAVWFQGPTLLAVPHIWEGRLTFITLYVYKSFMYSLQKTCKTQKQERKKCCNGPSPHFGVFPSHLFYISEGYVPCNIQNHVQHFLRSSSSPAFGCLLLLFLDILLHAPTSLSDLGGQGLQRCSRLQHRSDSTHWLGSPIYPTGLTKQDRCQLFVGPRQGCAHPRAMSVNHAHLLVQTKLFASDHGYKKLHWQKRCCKDETNTEMKEGAALGVRQSSYTQGAGASILSLVRQEDKMIAKICFNFKGCHSRYYTFNENISLSGTMGIALEAHREPFKNSGRVFRKQSKDVGKQSKAVRSVQGADIYFRFFSEFLSFSVGFSKLSARTLLMECIPPEVKRKLSFPSH